MRVGAYRRPRALLLLFRLISLWFVVLERFETRPDTSQPLREIVFQVLHVALSPFQTPFDSLYTVQNVLQQVRHRHGFGFRSEEPPE